mgnify:CR=1 FL=1
MIISCSNCNKQFKFNPSLIPDNGRDVKCGSCNHIWFYKLEDNKTELPPLIDNFEDNNVPETAFATGLGLLEYASRLYDEDENNYNENPVERFFERIRGWFNGFFQQK